MLLERYTANPIVRPRPEHHWEAGAVFNCAVTKTKEGEIVMLYRAIAADYEKSENGYTNYISSLGIAFSKNGYDFERREVPAISPDSEFDKFGCEDPRITRYADDDNDLYLITYTAMDNPAYSAKGGLEGLITTKDFRTYEKHGFIIPIDLDKDAVIFPEKIHNKVVMFHRIEPDIQAVYFDSLEELKRMDQSFWEDHYANYKKFTVMERRFEWESQKIGAGPPPIKTERGWLFIYHAVDEKSHYRAGAALLDLDNPEKVIARSPYPILEPEEEYEKYGDVNNVVFPEGAVVLDGKLFLYYGAADTYCALATVKLDDMLDYLEEFK